MMIGENKKQFSQFEFFLEKDNLMAKFTLLPFELKSAPTLKINTEFNHTDDSIFISYKCTGNLGAIDFGNNQANHQRIIGLWKQTCFELFIKNEKQQYIEFNFSPTFEWNAFYFEKKGMPLKEFDQIENMSIDILHSLEIFQLVAQVKKNQLPLGFLKGAVHAGISAVIKNKNEKLSYWAIEHHDTKPNFHHFDSFKCKF